MPQINVSSDELRRFANAIDGLRESLQQKRAATNRSYETLRSTWKDAKYQQFDKSFGQTNQELEQFLKLTASYTKYLRTKAAKLDAYLGNR